MEEIIGSVHVQEANPQAASARGRLAAALLLSMALGMGCRAPTEEPKTPAYPVRELLWNTRGGGDLAFEVEPAGNDFVLHVTRFEFEDLCAEGNAHGSEHEVLLTPQDGESHYFTRLIFTGEIDPAEFAFRPRGMTGTWTSLTVVPAAGEPREINNIASDSPLGELYRMAMDRVWTEEEEEDEDWE